MPSAPMGFRPAPTSHAARKPSCAPSARKAGAVAKASLGRSGRKANHCHGRLTLAAPSTRRRFPVRPNGPCDGAQVRDQFGIGWASPKPVAVVHAVDLEIGKKREDGWDVGTMDRVSGLEEPQ